MFQQFRAYPEKGGLNFSIKRTTLKFNDHEIEDRFKKSYFQSNLQMGRLCHLIAIFFYVVVSLWDALMVDPSRLIIWIWVLPLVILVFVAGLVGSYLKKELYETYWQQLFAFYVLITGVGFTFVTVMSMPNYPLYNFVGIIFCLFFCYAFIRLTFLWAALAGNTIVAVYTISISLFLSQPSELILSNFFYTFGINLLGMMVCYSHEVMSRRDFMLNELLKREEDQIKQMNLQLENQVEKRTRELQEQSAALEKEIAQHKSSEQERKLLADRLVQARKMESIGTLAGGIAHDFNNILSGIFGYAQLVEMDLDENSKARFHIRQVFKSAQRASALVQQILTFSRKAENEKQPLVVSIIIKEALKLLRASIPSTIKIQNNITCKSQVLADPTQFHQVIMNLCTNAYHAMRDTGGVLGVGLTEVTISDQDSMPELNRLPGKYLMLEVSDTGHGIDEKLMARIFDPYFTTKTAGEGTGLGLAIVQGIVENHHGFLEVDSEIHQGTCFRLYFPVIEEKSLQEVPLEKETPVLKGNENIMFVDDEETIRLIFKKFLEKYGYQVSIFENATAALKRFESAPDDFDLVITDMTMPGMTGDELSTRLLSLKPDLPIILCTGYSDRISEIKAKAMGIRKFVQKPMSNVDLARIIRRIFDLK